MSTRRGVITDLLVQLTEGNREVASKLVPLVYNELHRLADHYMRRERSNHTLQATALVNEAYLKLVQQRSVNWQTRAHFFGLAAQLMRRILTDHARRYLRQKRPGAHEVVPFEEAAVFSPNRSEELLRLDVSLERLTERDPRQGKIVELRFFGGLTVEETAGLLGISSKTVKREWSFAKAWLHGDMKLNHGNLAGEMGNR